MDWCRLSTSFYLDIALLRAGEPAEVLFLRCLAYAGAQESGGVIPNEVIPMLTPTKTKARLDALVREGLLVREEAGVRVRSWDRWQESLDVESERRRKDRERKAAERQVERLNGHEVYRLYDAEDRLLYVGQTNNLRERLRQHGYESPWHRFAVWCSLEAATDVSDALSIERQAIATEHPIHNISRGNNRPAGWHGRTLESVDSSRTRTEDASPPRPRIEVEVEVEETSSPRARRTRKADTDAPDVFPITESMRDWGRQHAPLVDGTKQTRQFLDHHRAKGSVFKDWTAAWRTWMGNAQTYAERDRTAAGIVVNADPATEWKRMTR